MSSAIEALRQAFLDLARGHAQNQPRRRLILPTGSVLHSLAGAFRGYFGTKIYTTHPKHGAHFTVLLYDATTAEPLAQFEANILGQIRTGAASGLATDLLASPQARTLAVIGSGFQAITQIAAVLAVRPIQRITVWSRNTDRRTAFAQDCMQRFGVQVLPADSADAAVQNADVIVTATNAKEPVIETAWVKPGAHINAVGSNQAQRRELPDALVHSPVQVVVDSREQAKLEAGDLLLAGVDPDTLAELADVVSGKVMYTHWTERITVFESLGLGLEDVAVAAYLYERSK